MIINRIASLTIFGIFGTIGIIGFVAVVGNNGIVRIIGITSISIVGIVSVVCGTENEMGFPRRNERHKKTRKSELKRRTCWKSQPVAFYILQGFIRGE